MLSLKVNCLFFTPNEPVLTYFLHTKQWTCFNIVSWFIVQCHYAGSKLLQELQSLFADGAGEAENLKNLAEALNINFRSFIKNATSFEESRKNLEREDILANLEISLLRLVRNLRKRKKRIRVRNIQCRDGVKKRKLACPHCDATFTAVSPKSLQQHVRSAHPKMPKLSIHQLPQEDKIKCLLKKMTTK